MTFTNTFFHETSKLFPPTLVPTFVMHAYPQNSLEEPPFVIINEKYVKDKEASYKLFVTLLGVSQQGPGE